MIDALLQLGRRCCAGHWVLAGEEVGVVTVRRRLAQEFPTPGSVGRPNRSEGPTTAGKLVERVGLKALTVRLGIRRTRQCGPGDSLVFGALSQAVNGTEWAGRACGQHTQRKPTKETEDRKPEGSAMASSY
jgi:hypothetical protein